MGLILTIENEESLQADVPRSVRVGRDGGIDIGRGANQDWRLPDPSRFISSRHCEVRYRDGAYWLYDISANGTYLNASTSRLQAPHRLAAGDRFMIGTYIIAVSIETDDELAEQPATLVPAALDETVPVAPHEWVSRAPAEAEARMREPSSVAGEDDPWRTEPVEAGSIDDEFLRRFAAGAGVPEQIFAHRDSLQVAEELGILFRSTIESLQQLLRARSEIGRTAGVSSQTTVQALDNNPLKFSPSAEDALRIMFGPRSRGFLDARRAIEGAFKDLQAHQIYTFGAMQQAVRMLVEDFDPKSIDAAAGPDHGLANLLQSRKARLWDIYVARWQAQTLHQDNGLAGAFLRYFGQCFDLAKGPNLH